MFELYYLLGALIMLLINVMIEVREDAPFSFVGSLICWNIMTCTIWPLFIPITLGFVLKEKGYGKYLTKLLLYKVF